MPKNIAISGASGFIGSYLVDFFHRQGYGVVSLTREILQNSAKLKQCLLGCEVIINLAGAPINHRWSQRYKQEMVKSRIAVTQALVNAVNESDVKPDLFISASAIGIYPSWGCHGEDSLQRGKGFLADLCVDWEKAAEGISGEVRKVTSRFGIVFAGSRGAFPKMIATAKWEIAVVPGSGRQSLSWISLEDLARGMEFLIRHPKINGAVNFTAPQQLTYREFAAAVSDYFSGIYTIRLPAMFLKLAMGEAASVLLQGQCAPPDRLLQAGFTFKHKSVRDFLDKLG